MILIPDELVNFLRFSSLIRLCACLGLNRYCASVSSHFFIQEVFVRTNTLWFD